MRQRTSMTQTLLPSMLMLIMFILQRPLAVLSLPQKKNFDPRPPISISLSSETAALGDSVTIQCHINPNSEEGALMTQSSMILYCPATSKDTFCFQNCRPQEECNNNGCRVVPALEGVTCRAITQADGEIVYEYTVKRLTQEWFEWRHPGFACRSAAEKTNWVRLRQEAENVNKNELPKADPTTTSSTTTTTTTTTTTPVPTTTTTTTATTPKPNVEVNPGTNTTKSASGSSGNSKAEDDAHWLNFLRNSSSGGFWTPEMIIIIALVALALSMLINCFCCVKWIVRRRQRNKRKLKGSDTFGCQSDFKASGVLPAMAWYPADPRMLPPGVTLTSQQMTPCSAFRRSIAIPDESLVENPPPWSPFENGNQGRAHPEGKAANGSSMSNSAGLNSDSGFSMAHASSGPQPIQLISNPVAYPMGFEPVGWSGPVTPRSRHLAHRVRHPFVPSYYVGLKRASSRETVFSERPMSEIGFEPVSHHPHHYIPVVLGPTGGVRASQPQLASMAAYGAPLCSPADASLIEKPGAGDGASAGGGSGSPKPGMAMLLPASVIGHQYGVIPPPSSSTERSSAPLLKADLTLKSKTMTPETTLEEAAGPNEPTGKSAAEVRMWLQSMPNADKDPQGRLPTKLADSLNTEYDVASDWSEREPMLMRDKPSSEEAPTTD